MTRTFRHFTGTQGTDGRLAAGKLRMFLAIDRVSKFTYVEFHEHANTTTRPAFLRSVVAAFPYQIRSKRI